MEKDNNIDTDNKFFISRISIYHRIANESVVKAIKHTAKMKSVSHSSTHDSKKILSHMFAL